jgi:hypothetical protein
MTVPPGAMNFDESGNRVDEPKQYDTLLKVRTTGGYAGIKWSTNRMPELMLRGLRAQLQGALAHVERQLMYFGSV